MKMAREHFLNFLHPRFREERIAKQRTDKEAAEMPSWYYVNGAGISTGPIKLATMKTTYVQKTLLVNVYFH